MKLPWPTESMQRERKLAEARLVTLRIIKAQPLPEWLDYVDMEDI